MICGEAQSSGRYRSVQALTAEKGGMDPVVLELTNLYHNLLRGWAEC